MPNDINVVRTAVWDLEAAGFEAAVFGGWAEELGGARTPGEHRDIDLLVLDAATDALDAFLAERQETPAKCLPHKRAFLLDGVLIELLLAHRTAGGAEILWWGDNPVELPGFAITEVAQLPVVDAETLACFRRLRARLPDGLWDHDFHPDEPDVRTFIVPPSGVLLRDDSLVVTVARYGEQVLKHYAFGDRWFKINVTTDLDGRPAHGDHGFTFNCDIATPMVRDGASVHAVDLFLDVLVDQAGRDYDVVDREEFTQAVQDGLVSEREAAASELHLERLLDIIRGGDLVRWLDALCPFAPCAARTALPVVRTPITPLVAATTRPSW